MIKNQHCISFIKIFKQKKVYRGKKKQLPVPLSHLYLSIPLSFLFGVQDQDVICF